MLTQCDVCKGSGLVRRKTPFQCKNCSNNGCYLCENKQFKGIYKECTMCHGSGASLHKQTSDPQAPSPQAPKLPNEKKNKNT